MNSLTYNKTYLRSVSIFLILVFLISTALVPPSAGVFAQETEPTPNANHGNLLYLPSISVGAALSAPTPAWQEYVDPRYGYKLAIPAAWEIVPTPLDGNFATASFANYAPDDMEAHEPLGSGAVKIDINLYKLEGPVSLADWTLQYAKDPGMLMLEEDPTIASQIEPGLATMDFAPSTNLAEAFSLDSASYAEPTIEEIESSDLVDVTSGLSVPSEAEALRELEAYFAQEAPDILDDTLSVDVDNPAQRASLTVDDVAHGVYVGAAVRMKTVDDSHMKIVTLHITTDQVLVFHIWHGDDWPEQDVQAILDSVAFASDADAILPTFTPAPLAMISSAHALPVVPESRRIQVIHPCGEWGNEVSGTPVMFHLPFEPGTTWRVGGSGSYYSDGAHTNRNNDYYATDWNMGSGDADLGQPVYPVADGLVVKVVKSNQGFGNYVEIQHFVNGTRLRSRYAHLQNTYVNQGNWVGVQHKLGMVGRSGNSGSAHLHLSIELYKNGQWVSQEGNGVRPSPMWTNNGFEHLCDGYSYTVSAKPSLGRKGGVLHYYWNGNIRDSFYTANFNELRLGRWGYRYQGILGRVYTTSMENYPTTPLLRYWNPGNRDHHYTTNPDELGQGNHGYHYEGVVAYLPIFAGIPVYRYWNPSISDHRLSTDPNSAGAGWRSEGQAGFLRD